MRLRQFCIVLIFTCLTLGAFAGGDTSITIDGKVYGLYRVKDGETLYSVAQAKGVDLAELKKVNRIGEGGSVKVDDLLIIPLYSAKTAPVVTKKETKTDVKVQPKTGSSTHIVQQGETLYAISRQYGTTPAVIKDLNGLTTDNVEIGQELRVTGTLIVKTTAPVVPVAPVSPPKVTNTAPVTTPTVKVSPMEDTGDPKLDMKMLNKLKETFAQEEAGKGMVDISRGMAGLMQDTGGENDSKFYALHKTASTGTVLKVRNLMNNRIVYVKVLGRLPDSGDNKNMTVKLSGAAASYLKVIDPKFQVEITEYK